jgi:hypothetical protein
MAKVRTQNGRVILKNNRVSCECCNNDFACDARYQFPGNIFEITREEYSKYLNRRGTWIADYSETQFESGKILFPATFGPLRNASVFGAALFSNRAPTSSSFSFFNCFQFYNYAHEAPRTLVGIFPAVEGSVQVQENAQWGFNFNLQLKQEDQKYYAQFRIGSCIASSSSEPPCQVSTRFRIPFENEFVTVTHPTNPANYSVDGNNVIGCAGVGGCSGFVGTQLKDTSLEQEYLQGTKIYQNNNSSTITLRFVEN